MSAPTRPGWYRVRHGEHWLVRHVLTFKDGLCVVGLPGQPLVSDYQCSEWGSRVEFPGDEPAPDLSELVDFIDKTMALTSHLCAADPRSLAPGDRDRRARGQLAREVERELRLAGVDTDALVAALDAKHESKTDEPAPGLPDGYRRTKTSLGQSAVVGPSPFYEGKETLYARWGLGGGYSFTDAPVEVIRAVLALEPIEDDDPADDSEVDPQRNQLPPGWTIERLGHGAWWCAERETPPMPITGFSRASRHDAIAAARACVRKREAEEAAPPLAGLEAPTFADVRKAIHLMSGADSTRAATIDAAIDAVWICVTGRGPVDEPDEPEQRWAWVDACPEGQRREQTLEDGAAIETRIVDRRDEP